MISEDNSNIALEKIMTFNDILSPLMLAISEKIGISNDKNNCDLDALLLAKLVDNVVEKTNEYISDNSIEETEHKRWTISSNISKIVAINYSKTKEILNEKISDMGLDLESEPEIKTFHTEEEFKNSILESIASIVNVVKRFNFAIEEEKIISGAKNQITIYANDLFEHVDKELINKKYFNHLYVLTIENLSKIFIACYYNSIDATLSVPKEKREEFINRHMISSSDSIEKLLDSFYNRVSIISNISMNLKAPINKAKA